jgi:hypothetical protein
MYCVLGSSTEWQGSEDFSEVEQRMGCPSMEDDDHLLVLQHRVGDDDHVFLHCAAECRDTAGKLLSD